MCFQSLAFQAIHEAVNDMLLTDIHTKWVIISVQDVCDCITLYMIVSLNDEVLGELP